MPFRCAVLACCVLLTPLRAQSPVPGYDRVTIEPTKTSIYVGSVSLTLPELVRQDGRFEAPYAAKVVPFFFYNETGRLFINVSDEQLQTLQRGEPIDFTGRAVAEAGGERRVEGRATPADARSGKIKVRVFYSRRIELIFNTTYRFDST